MNDEQVRELIKATISYCMGQFHHWSGNAYDNFLEAFEERPPDETDLPEPALGILKQYIEDEWE